jgi:hypothetical protein
MHTLNFAASGILADNEMTHRVMSQFVNPADTSVKDVMTKGPKCVRSQDSTLDALGMIVDIIRSRHLLVLDKDDVMVVSVLCWRRCTTRTRRRGAALVDVMCMAMKSATRRRQQQVADGGDAP